MTSLTKLAKDLVLPREKIELITEIRQRRASIFSGAKCTIVISCPGKDDFMFYQSRDSIKNIMRYIELSKRPPPKKL